MVILQTTQCKGKDLYVIKKLKQIGVLPLETLEVDKLCVVNFNLLIASLVIYTINMTFLKKGAKYIRTKW
jgi:hypothetical protein